MKNDTVEISKKDVEFLLSFAPAFARDEVEDGLAPMFYITNSYAGDMRLIGRLSDIIDEYGLDRPDASTKDLI